MGQCIGQFHEELLFLLKSGGGCLLLLNTPVLQPVKESYLLRVYCSIQAGSAMAAVSFASSTLTLSLASTALLAASVAIESISLAWEEASSAAFLESLAASWVAAAQRREDSNITLI